MSENSIISVNYLSTHTVLPKPYVSDFPVLLKILIKEEVSPLKKGLSDFPKSHMSHIPFPREKCRVMSESPGLCQNFSFWLDPEHVNNIGNLWGSLSEPSSSALTFLEAWQGEVTSFSHHENALMFVIRITNKSKKANPSAEQSHMKRH